MLLLYICRTKASSWSFTTPLFLCHLILSQKASQYSRFPAIALVLGDVLRDGPQQVPACTEALPQVRGGGPDQSAAGNQQKRRNPRLLEPSPLRNESGQCQHDDRVDGRSAHKAEHRSQKPIEPAHSHTVDGPANDATDDSREHDDNKKYGKEPGYVRRPLGVDVWHVPRCNPRVLPGGQQISRDHAR